MWEGVNPRKMSTVTRSENLKTQCTLLVAIVKSDGWDSTAYCTARYLHVHETVPKFREGACDPRHGAVAWPLLLRPRASALAVRDVVTAVGVGLKQLELHSRLRAGHAALL